MEIICNFHDFNLEVVSAFTKSHMDEKKYVTNEVWQNSQ